MTKQLTWQTVGVLAILAGTTVALSALSHWDAPEIIAAIGVLSGIGAASAVGGAITNGVSQRVDQIQQETTAQTETIQTIERRTNGELDARIAAAMEEAAEMGAARAVAVLQADGKL